MVNKKLDFFKKNIRFFHKCRNGTAEHMYWQNPGELFRQNTKEY